MRKILSLLLFVLITATKSNAQGCSDAGVCSIHSIKNNTSGSGEEEDKSNEIVIGFAFAKGERNTSVYTPYIEYTRSIAAQTSVTAKVNFSAVTGELANTSGPGDLFVSVTHVIDSKKKWQKSFVIGLKMALGQADIMKKGIHLPMPYQTRLGTTDLVLGLSYSRRSFGATLALQQPLKKINHNRFLPTDYPLVPLVNEYLPTNYFERKGDAVLRFSYTFDIKNSRLTIRPSLLGIYHLGNDSYSDMNKMRIEIEKSGGLTLNGNIFVGYRLNKSSALEISAGAPFVVRANRPDGLTRSLVASVEYRLKF